MSFYLCFLEAVAALGMSRSRVQSAHITTVVSHKEICRAGGGFDPRIEQMTERTDVRAAMRTMGMVRCTVWPVTHESKYPETRQ